MALALGRRQGCVETGVAASPLRAAGGSAGLFKMTVESGPLGLLTGAGCLGGLGFDASLALALDCLQRGDGGGGLSDPSWSGWPSPSLTRAPSLGVYCPPKSCHRGAGQPAAALNRDRLTRTASALPGRRCTAPLRPILGERVTIPAAAAFIRRAGAISLRLCGCGPPSGVAAPDQKQPVSPML